MTQATVKIRFAYDQTINAGAKEQVLSVDGVDTKFASKSDMFKAMFDNGASVAEISKIVGSHYSFVYGVISSTREIQKTTGSSKSDAIRAMVAAGKTPGQIAKELNSNYSFVHSVAKKYKAEIEAAVKKAASK